MTSEALHLAVAHLPLFGLAAASVVLAVGLIGGQRQAQFAGLLLALLVASSIPLVMGSGESAFQRYQEAPAHFGLDDQGVAWAKVHFARAQQAAKPVYLTAVVALLGLVTMPTLPKFTRWLTGLCLLPALAGVGMAIWAAQPAFSIRRADFRAGPAPEVSVSTDLRGIVEEAQPVDAGEAGAVNPVANPAPQPVSGQTP